MADTSKVVAFWGAYMAIRIRGIRRVSRFTAWYYFEIHNERQVKHMLKLNAVAEETEDESGDVDGE